MLKLIGAMLILSAGTLFGFFQSFQYSRRPKHLRSLIQALQRLETEIAYGFTPLPDALAAISRQSPKPLSAFFEQAASRLEGRDAPSIRESWRSAVDSEWKNTAMKENEKQIMNELGLTIGMTDREDQVKHLRLAVLQLQGEEEQAREEQRRYETMWRSLGVLLGVLIVILIY